MPSVIFCFVTIVWIYAVPGYVAKRDQVLSSDGVAARLTGKVAEQWAAYKARRAELQHRVDRIDATVASDDSRGRDVAGLASLRQQYLTELQSRAPFTVSGMVGDLLNEIWLISYLSLGLFVAFWLRWGPETSGSSESSTRLPYSGVWLKLRCGHFRFSRSWGRSHTCSGFNPQKISSAEPRSWTFISPNLKGIFRATLPAKRWRSAGCPKEMNCPVMDVKER